MRAVKIPMADRAPDIRDAEPTRVVRLWTMGGRIAGGGIELGLAGDGEGPGAHVGAAVMGACAGAGGDASGSVVPVRFSAVGPVRFGVAFAARVAKGAGIGAETLRGPSEGAGIGTEAFIKGTTTDVPVDGEKEKDVIVKLTGAPYQGPDPKFCHALRCRRSKPVGLGTMLLSAGDQDVAKPLSGFSTRKTMSDEVQSTERTAKEVSSGRANLLMRPSMFHGAMTC
jgi:hypothetical protein